MRLKITAAALIMFAATLIIYSTFALSANLAHAAVASISDASNERVTLRQAAFGQAHLPRSLPAVTVGIHSSRFPFANLRRIDRLTHRMPGDFESRMYLLHPRRSNHRLLVFHTGHNDGFESTHYRYRDNLRFFNAQGYTILAVAMPLTGMNPTPAWMQRSGDHNGMAGMARPLRPFLEPIAVGLNHALKDSYRSVSMTGLSGGGWTTTVYSAIDERIESSYPVAGSYPMEYRSARDIGDFEQRILVDYRSLYVMAATHGRRQLQILNRYDPCCFAGTGFKKWEHPVAALAARLGGEYGVWLDDNDEHSISERAEHIIDRDINRN